MPSAVTGPKRKQIVFSAHDISQRRDCGGRGGGLEDEQGLLSAGNWITSVDRKGCRAELNVNCENKKVRQIQRDPLFIFLAAFSFYAV